MIRTNEVFSLDKEKNSELEGIKTQRKLTENEQQELFSAISHGNNNYRAKELINIMDDINERILSGFGNETLLALSTKFQNAEIVRFLIELGVDVNIVCDVNKQSSLMYAVCDEDIKIVQMLINAGVNLNYIDENNESALSYTTMENNIEAFELLISSGLIDIEKCGGMALLFASSNLNLYFVQRLIELDVDVNFADLCDGSTALHYASEKNHLGIVQLLMKNGADETVKSKEGKTAIELTKEEKIIEFIRNYNPSKFILK